MCIVPKPYPKEFREDVVRVARAREAGVTLAQVAKDFGITASCLRRRLTQDDVEAGIRPGVTKAENVPPASCWTLPIRRVNAMGASDRTDQTRAA